MILGLLIIGFIIIDIFLFIKFSRLFYQKKGEFSRDMKYLYSPSKIKDSGDKYLNYTVIRTKLMFYLIGCIIVIFAELLILQYLR
jgi:hypothetical protein